MPPPASKLQITPRALIVRCLLERRGDHWQAFSLEFGLAAQAETEPEVRRKLKAMVESYLYDALVGEDQEHVGKLLARRATTGVFLKYYLTWIKTRLGGLGGASTYQSPIPMVPAHCAV